MAREREYLEEGFEELSKVGVKQSFPFLLRSKNGVFSVNPYGAGDLVNRRWNIIKKETGENLNVSLGETDAVIVTEPREPKGGNKNG